MDTKDDFVRNMHSKLDQWSNEIDALVAKVDKTEEQVQAEFHQQIEALRSKQDEVHQQLYELEHASEGAWEDMKLGIEMALDDISEAIDSAISRFK
jgi:uncharacterized coiled-coil DUF342 family protein